MKDSFVQSQLQASSVWRGRGEREIKAVREEGRDGGRGGGNCAEVVGVRKGERGETVTCQTSPSRKSSS